MCPGDAASLRRSSCVVLLLLACATPEGVQDLSGNVWEWTSSPMSAYPGATPFTDSMSQYRVIRGGAFDTSDSIATGWTRGYSKVTAPANDLANTGFPCVVPIP